MDNNNILQKMEALRLHGMYNLYKNMLDTNQYESLTNEELLTVLINAEWDNKENKRIDRYVTLAKFRYRATMRTYDMMMTESWIDH